MLNLCHSILSTVKFLLRATMLRLCFIKLSTSFPFVYLCCLFEFSSFALIIFFWLVNLLYTQNIFSFFPVSSMASDSPPPPTPHSVLRFCILFIDTFFIVFLGPWFQNFLLTVFVSWYAVLIYLSRIILWQGQHRSMYFKMTQKVRTLWLPERHFNKRMQNNKNYDVKMFCCACSSCKHAFTKIYGEN